MQQSGAVAVVIGDWDQPHWVTMYAPAGDTADISIPSVFLPRTEFRALVYLTSNNNTPLLVSLQRDETWPWMDMLLIIFVSPSIMLLFIYLSYKIRSRQRKLQEIAPMNVVARLAIKTFYHEKRLENEADSCAICLEDYAPGEELRVLPCNHDFHPICVDAWLTTQKKYCPLCKVNITFATSHNNEITPLIHTFVV
ncbi:hypothetical protein [Absidia glauca]|uniref:RING-type domain-containing protein n=1 Tax=Absidia glauca TaxID=4829 RepID=A0A163J9A0_ABSGL|nr:hypothetical protein [Absidia glauca]